MFYPTGVSGYGRGLWGGGGGGGAALRPRPEAVLVSPLTRSVCLGVTFAAGSNMLMHCEVTCKLRCWSNVLVE